MCGFTPCGDAKSEKGLFSNRFLTITLTPIFSYDKILFYNHKQQSLKAMPYPLTIPDAMLFAKLTRCSHGNGSCEKRKRESVRDELLAYIMVWLHATLSVNNRGNCYIIAPITDENSSHPNFFRNHYNTTEKRKRKNAISSVTLMFCDLDPVGDLENIPTGIPHLETLHSSFASTQLCFLSLISLTVCVRVFPLPIAWSSPRKVHLRWAGTQTSTRADDVRPLPQAGGKKWE